MLKVVVLVAVCLVVASQAKYFEENFDASWSKRWVVSGSKGEAAGVLENSDEQYYEGVKTSQDLRFYQASASFPKFSNTGKDLIIQYAVRNSQVIDCGGAYLKLGPSGLNQKEFHGESPYNIMFGPDVCGSTNVIHVILANGGTNHLTTKKMAPKRDQLTHVYTLRVHPDNTFSVDVDGSNVGKGTFEEDFNILPPKEINDPAQSKPADWVDAAKIDDPTAVKPEDWDSIPATIADPDAKKPDDWDDELDGTWERPEVPNPEYRGPWIAPKIDNPDYKGPWVHPKIANPDYAPNPNLYAYSDFGFVGIDIWQVKSGTVFKSILITDNEEEAAAHLNKYWTSVHEAEKTAFDADKAAKMAATQAAAEGQAYPDEDEEDLVHPGHKSEL